MFKLLHKEASGIQEIRGGDNSNLILKEWVGKWVDGKLV
jgi:hypothetical protein